MARLNALHRGTAGATDVLSFPQEEPFDMARDSPAAAGAHLGDIVICADVARANARRAGRPLRAEIAVLAVHGLLHLLGYDHETDRGQMRALERRVRRSLRLGPLGDEEIL